MPPGRTKRQRNKQVVTLHCHGYESPGEARYGDDWKEGSGGLVWGNESGRDASPGRKGDKNGQDKFCASPGASKVRLSPDAVLEPENQTLILLVMKQRPSTGGETQGLGWDLP
jgi:hypothetical protein